MISRAFVYMMFKVTEEEVVIITEIWRGTFFLCDACFAFCCTLFVQFLNTLTEAVHAEPLVVESHYIQTKQNFGTNIQPFMKFLIVYRGFRSTSMDYIECEINILGHIREIVQIIQRSNQNMVCCYCNVKPNQISLLLIYYNYKKNS